MSNRGKRYRGERRSFNNGKVCGYMIIEYWAIGDIRTHYLNIWGGRIMECFHSPMELRLVKTPALPTRHEDQK